MGRAQSGATNDRAGWARRIAVGAFVLFCLAGSAWLLRPNLARDGPGPAERSLAPAPDALAGARPLASTTGGAASRRVDPDLAARFDIPAAARTPVGGSLRGTEVDGGIEVDSDGHFLPSRRALLLFDYFLSLSGEEPVEVIRGRIVLHILRTTPSPADEEAIAALDRYLAMREAARALVQSGHAPQGLERRLQWIRELRREHLGPELNEAFYGEEERTALIDLERRQWMLDEEIDEEERAARLAALDEELPESVREARERASAAARTRQQVEQLRADGASEREIFELREREFGSEAAERLAALDQRRAAWEQNLAQFKRERVAILVDETLTPQEQQAEVAALLARSFEERERARALTLAEADDPR